MSQVQIGGSHPAHLIVGNQIYIKLAEVFDVKFPNGVTSGQVLTYDESTHTWTAADPTGGGGGGGGGGSTRIIQLTGDYTLTSNDDNTIFWTTIPVTVTIPTLTTMPACAFLPPTSGSITLHPVSVLVDGVTADQVASLLTHPTGISLLPRYGATNSYTTSGKVPTFAGLPDAPRSNTQLAALLDAKANVPTAQAPLRLTSSHTITSDEAGRVFFQQATVTRTLTIPTGLPTTFSFYVGVITGATAAVTVAGQVGVTLISANNAYRLSQVGAVCEVRCTGTQDEYMFVSSPYWIV